MNKKKIFNIVFMLFMIRILFLILIPPFIGIANNGDFQRLMNPVGLDYKINIWDNGENYRNHCWNWITNEFVYIEPINNGWHQIFAIFPYIAIALSNKIFGGYFDIRFLGVVNAAFYCFAVFILVRLIEKIKSYLSYVLLAVAVIVLGDSYILQYFNSFYTEIGSVTFALLFWELLVIALLYGKDRGIFQKVVLIIINSVVALFAIMSKQQDILLVLPVIVIFFTLFKRFKFKFRFFILWAICFMICIGISFKVNTAGGNITSFNVTSCDLLMLSEKPEEHLKELGFEDKDIEIIMSGVGNSAFSLPYDWKIYGDKFTRMTEIKMIMKEPKIFFKMAYKRAAGLFTDAPLGNYMQSSGAAGQEKTKENRIWYNLKNIIYAHNLYFYIAVVLIALIFALMGSKIKAFSDIPRDLFYIYACLPIANILRFVTVLLGDSSHDDLKHFFSINFEFDFMFLCNMILMVKIIVYVLERMGITNDILAHSLKTYWKTLVMLVICIAILYIGFSGLRYYHEKNAVIGTTMDSMNVENGVYADGWIEKNSSFKIRAGEEGEIRISLWNPQELKGNEEICIYVNEKLAYEGAIEEQSFYIDVEGKPNKVNKVDIETNAYIIDKGADARQLSLVLINVEGR